MIRRWWCRQGELLWSDERSRVLFLWDNGRMWGLDVGRTGETPGGENSCWDHEALQMVEGRLAPSLAVDQRRNLFMALTRASPFTRGRMSEVQTKIIDRVASALDSTDGRPWVTAKRLRNEFQAFGVDTVTAAAMSLCPRHMSLRQGSGSDYFEATFAGLLESQIKERVVGVVDATLQELRRAYSADPDMNMMRWSPIRQALGADDKEFAFVRNVHGAMGWPTRNQRDGQEWSFDVPDDVEQIHHCSTLAEYLRYLPTQTLRPWPTAPQSLAELSDAVEEDAWLNTRVSMPEVPIAEEAAGAPIQAATHDSDLVRALQSISESLAACYRQALRDIDQDDRESFVGPAAALRELVTAVLHDRAPDSALAAQPGFKPEGDHGRPSRAQRVRHIVQSRAAVSPDSIDRALDGLDAIVGDIYARASKATHLGAAGQKELVTLANYVHGILRDLLLD